ncbi:MAG: sigma-70 family RNA polymerase sigma factor [Ruminiclostridium sp.]|nr:sigma-70 family RNA polymerase sigma factor [Ruminiclostridium sp.]
MKDSEIIELYFARSEDAITETDKKHGAFCRSMTFGILGSYEDSDECVNDTYLRLWEIIPPQRPEKFRAFIARIARNIALNMLDRMSAKKRGGRYGAAYDELSESIPSTENVEKRVDDKELSAQLDKFLRSLDREKQLIFLKRYWYMRTVAEIAAEMSVSESKVKMSLHRTREKLREYLEKEGVQI